MKIFLSYAKEDGAIVKEFHDYLKTLGFDPWMDQERLLPGHAWEREIDKALGAANVVILFLSPKSVQKRSFVTREANQAVANLRYKKVDDIYIIPVLIEECEVPEEISGRAQYVNISTPGAKSKIVEAIRRAAEQQGIAINQGVDHGEYKISSRSCEDEKPGRPGHEISIEYPEFVSSDHPGVALVLSEYFKARAINIVVKHRSKPWEQYLGEEDDPWRDMSSYSTHGRWDKFGIISATKKYISVYFNCSWYGAGAAHGNEFHEGHNFSIVDDTPYPFDIFSLFTDCERAASIISGECRKQLAKEFWNRTGKNIEDDELDRGSFLSSTEPQLDKFEIFTVGEGKLTFYFEPYSIAAYALGSFAVDVSFYDLREVLATGDRSPINFEAGH